MFIRYMSDLHLEFGVPKYLDPLVPMPEDRDSILVLAGDIGLGVEGIRWANSLTDRFLGVIYVPGNHEFYGEYWEDLIEKMRAEAEGVILLDPKAVASFHVHGISFVGATLWTDFDRGDPNVMFGASKLMSDYKKISTHGKRFTAHDVLARHKEHKAHIFKTIKVLEHVPVEDRKPIVVVSHHLPSYVCIHPDYKYDDLNPCYASNLDSLLLEVEPAYWFFGHTHRTVDVQPDGLKTRFLNNPHGYYGHELNPEFDPCARVEIDV